MSELSKFARQRLAQQAAGDHPDANLLSAFAEGGLTRREREQVLSHLGTCATCREAVSLALPEVPAAVPAAPPARTGWARWPMLRWAGVAAAVVVVAAAVVVQNSRRSMSPANAVRVESVAKPAEAKPPAALLADEKAAPVREDRAAGKESGAPEPVRDSLRAKAENMPEKKKDAAPMAVGDAVTALNENGAAPGHVALRPQASAEPAELAAASPMKARSSAAGAAAPTAGAVLMDRVKPQQPTVIPPQAASANRSVEVVAQSEATSTHQAETQAQKQLTLNRVAGERAPVPATTSGGVIGGPTMKAAMAAPQPHWRVSSEGALERSTDAGRTWQFVRVGSAATTFRSFCSVGRDLWAGGTGGALYHSPDNGHTWQRVPVKAGETVLESDIARVEFADTQHGTVTTTTGETWATTDGGATWSVRR